MMLPQFAASIRPNSYNLRFDYGNSDYDVRHTFTSYITYSLPTPSHAKLLLGGWQLNSLMSFYTGTPFTVYVGQKLSGTFEGQDLVDVIGDPFKGVNQSLTNGAVQWVNPAAFAQPGGGHFRECEAQPFYGPGFADVDFSLFKNTSITERITSQFRIEMFNIFNHTNLRGPPPPASAPAASVRSPTPSATTTAPPASAPESLSTFSWR